MLAVVYNKWRSIQIQEDDNKAALETTVKTIEQFQKVISLDPSDVSSWCWLAYNAELLQSEKYKKIASRAITEAQRKFPLLNPAEQPDQMNDAMLAACALAELYSDRGMKWFPNSVPLFQLVAAVDIDSFPLDFPENSKNDVIEYKSLAQRRLAVLEDDIARAKKESKGKTTKSIITFVVTFVVVIIICMCLLYLFIGGSS